MSCNGTTCGLFTHSCLTVMGGNKRGHTVCVTFPQGGTEKREERQLKLCFNFIEATQTEAYVQIISHHMLRWLKCSDGCIYILCERSTSSKLWWWPITRVSCSQTQLVKQKSVLVLGMSYKWQGRDDCHVAFINSQSQTPPYQISILKKNIPEANELLESVSWALCSGSYCTPWPSSCIVQSGLNLYSSALVRCQHWKLLSHYSSLLQGKRDIRSLESKWFSVSFQNCSSVSCGYC